MSPHARRLWRRFEALIAACGPYHAAPAKTRVAYLARVRFASLSRASATTITITFALPRPVRSARLQQVTEAVPGWWVHTLRVAQVSDLDAVVAGWLCRSYRLMGMRERLRPRVR